MSRNVNKGARIMGYEFHTSPEIEYPFFLQMGNQLGGKRRKKGFNGKECFDYCKCPACGKKKSVLGFAKSANTFIFVCPVETCSIRSLSLHDLIKRVGTQQTFQEWRKARWKTTYTEDWLPIRHRR